MPDLHEGKRAPNGVVVATENLIYPELVGSDIGCGISAIGFHDTADRLRSSDLQELLKQLENHAARDGRYQMGTIGRGNHFMELARASSGQLWAVVHTGSRAMGQHITAHHLSWIDTAALQSHQGRTVMVHRKSANIATADRLSLIAGSMLVGSRIVQGLGNPDSLESSAHGAGRVLSRSQAADSLVARELSQCMKSVVWHERQAKQLVDESPKAYRDLHEVMAAQRDLVKTVDTLTPIMHDKRI